MLKSVKEETTEYWNELISKLIFQGNFKQLLIDKKLNITWKSAINNIPNGIFAFAIIKKKCVNGLNTPDNLKRWGILKTDKCDQCGNFGNLEHTLDWCKSGLDQGHFTWRHNSILTLANVGGDWTIYADIPGFTLNGGTIPPGVLLTSKRPDLVFLDRRKKSIDIFEITCSLETKMLTLFI